VTELLLDAAGLRQTLARKGITISWFSLGSVPLLEIGAREGADVALIDLQHGLWNRDTAYAAIGAARTTTLVRAADSSFARIGEALDLGPAGVLVPLVETEAQARAVVSAARFPPEGDRSGGGVRPLSQGFEQYYRDHREPVVGVMIESQTGVTHAGAIARVKGVDFVFIGTGDLALSLGCFPNVDRRLDEACKKIFAACRSAGTPCGIFTGSPELARQKLAEGYRAVVIADDINVVKSGFARAIQGFGSASRQPSAARGAE
jgi:2-keto-3-deoxy-L-rhamnonate aldolase RhmA